MRKQNLEEKQMYDFKRQPDKIAHENTWTWLQRGTFKSKTESILIAAEKTQ